MFAIPILSLGLLLAGCSSSPIEFTQTEVEGPTTEGTAVVTGEGNDPTSAPTRASLSPQVLAEMEELEGQVLELRGLPPTGPVDRQLLTASELERRIQEDLLEDYSAEEAADDARLLALFGMIPADFDLWDFYQDLYTEQIAGFYDDEEAVLYVLEGAEFDGPERLTYVHEYAHALQDQHFDLAEGLDYDEESCQLESERCAAVQALLEGDASLLEEQWLRTYASQQDYDDLLEFYGGFQSPTFDQAPRALQLSFVFPYQQGLEFVRWNHQQGGWAAVDEIYPNPPSSTEMILHPLRYPDDTPKQLDVVEPEPGELGSGWRLLDQGTLGEFDLYLLLSEVLPEEAASEAAAGWAGDYYVAFYNDEELSGAWYIIHQWDTIRDAQDTYLTWRDYGEELYGPRIPDGRAYEWDSEGGYARLELSSNQTLWLVAPEADSRQALRQLIEFPAVD
jgi:hypothetical protein